MSSHKKAWNEIYAPLDWIFIIRTGLMIGVPTGLLGIIVMTFVFSGLGIA